MMRAMIAASVVFTLAVATPVLAQGKSQQQKKKTAPPSRNELSIAPVSTSATSATPLAWVDDASLLAPGAVAFSVSAMRWQGGGISEVDAPIVDAAFGLTPRVQLSASVPRVVGSADPAGAAGGIGTSFFSAKIAMYETPDHNFKVATGPTLQLLGRGIVESLGSEQSRVRWGLPVSAEVSRGTARLYGGGGYFSPGLWFSGVAAGFAITDKANASVGVSRAWRRTETPDVLLSERDRKEISGGASYALRPTISVFGSIGRTFATLEENGAGTSISGGLSIFFATQGPRP
jgi:hypothetical protein